MSLQLPKAPNAGLFKPGYQTTSSEDQAVQRNIAACHEIASIVRTSLGPNGRNKFIINHLQKLFITNDAATILRELEVVHPAAKLVVMASQQQEAEMGDATNFVITLAGELLDKAEELLRIGLHPSEIMQGYEMAQEFAVKTLEDLSMDKVSDLTDPKQIARAIKSSICSKQYGFEDFLAGLVAEAIATVMPKQAAHFNVDNVRVVKIMGSSVSQSKVVRGMVFPREPEGQVKNAKHCKIGIYSCAIDIGQTETKGTVLLHNAKELLKFSEGEEDHLEQAIRDIAATGLRVIISGQAIGDLALHYLNRYNILALRVASKFELRRLCRVVGASPLARLGPPMPEEMGTVDIVETLEIGGDRVACFRQEEQSTRTVTIVLRGATQNHLDDLERAIDDGVSVIKSITKNPLLVPGAGATEMQLLERISDFGFRTPGLLQHPIKKYAEALEVIPRTLAENAGLESSEVLSRLYAAHSQKSTWSMGVDIENEHKTGICNAAENEIWDTLAAKSWALKLATEAARTVLSVDMIIVAKAAGGPKPPSQQPQNWDEDD